MGRSVVGMVESGIESNGCWVEEGERWIGGGGEGKGPLEEDKRMTSKRGNVAETERDVEEEQVGVVERDGNEVEGGNGTAVGASGETKLVLEKMLKSNKTTGKTFKKSGSDKQEEKEGTSETGRHTKRYRREKRADEELNGSKGWKGGERGGGGGGVYLGEMVVSHMEEDHERGLVALRSLVSNAVVGASSVVHFEVLIVSLINRHLPLSYQSIQDGETIKMLTLRIQGSIVKPR